MATAQKNFRRMMRWLKGRDDIEITTYRALMNVYGRQKEAVTRDELREIARKTLALEALVPTDDLSPAEAFAGLAQAIVGYRKNGTLPERSGSDPSARPDRRCRPRARSSPA